MKTAIDYLDEEFVTIAPDEDKTPIYAPDCYQLAVHADRIKKVMHAYAREAIVEHLRIEKEFDAKQIPDYDGRFLGFIVQKQECGTFWKYWRVVFCEFNEWKLEPGERITHWRFLPDEPGRTVKLL